MVRTRLLRKVALSHLELVLVSVKAQCERLDGEGSEDSLIDSEGFRGALETAKESAESLKSL